MYLFHDCELLVSFETINKIELILVPILSEGDQRPLITQLHRHTDKIFKYFCDTAAKIFLSSVCWYIVVYVRSRGVSQNTKVTTHVEKINSQMSQNILMASLCKSSFNVSRCRQSKKIWTMIEIPMTDIN